MIPTFCHPCMHKACFSSVHVPVVTVLRMLCSHNAHGIVYFIRLDSDVCMRRLIQYYVLSKNEANMLATPDRKQITTSSVPNRPFSD